MSVIIRCLPLTLVCAALLGQTAPQPNIVLFLSDDLRWHHVGFNGDTAVPTPNTDRIASEGVKLTQFNVQPVCSPTRAFQLTVRYALKNGMDVRPPADRNYIAGLWPLAPLAGLEALELGANRLSDLQPLAGMVQLRTLCLGGNDLAKLYPLSGLEGLQGLTVAGRGDLEPQSGSGRGNERASRK